MVMRNGDQKSRQDLGDEEILTGNLNEKWELERVSRGYVEKR